MVKVQDQFGDAMRSEPGDDAPDHRLAGDRNRRLRADISERAQPCAKAGGEHECVANGIGHKPIGRTAFAKAAVVEPAATRRTTTRTKTYIVKHSSAKAGKPK